MTAYGPMNVDVFHQLKDFGIESVLAREAACRYESVAAAVDWCFGSGANWKPEPVVDESVRRDIPDHLRARHIEHSKPSAPSLPPRPSPLSPLRSPNRASKPFASNNPFAKLTSTSNPDNPNSIIDLTGGGHNNDDDDADLQRALRLSRGEPDVTGWNGSADANTEVSEKIEDTRMDIDPPEGEGRQDRERSVRATAPPPSPDPTTMTVPTPSSSTVDTDDTEMALGTLFGPSNKDEDGRTALVPTSNPTPSNEDDDLNKAIQESLMTASFHSASAIQEVERPTALPREKGAPLVLLSQSGESTYAANVLQAIYAVPQLRDILINSMIPRTTTNRLGKVPEDLRTIVEEFESKDGGDSFKEVDEVLRELRRGYTPSQLPPIDPARELFNYLTEVTRSWLTDQLESQPDRNINRPGPYWTSPDDMFLSRMTGPISSATHVNFRRSPAVQSNDLYTHLASILWPTASTEAGTGTGTSMISLGEVLTVFIAWEYGAKRELWKLDEKVVLDRFMRDNEAWSLQVRASLAVAAGNSRRLKERIDHLTTYNGNDIHTSLTTLIKHYETSPEDDQKDNLRVETRTELKAKLEKTLAQLQHKVELLKFELAEEEKALSGSLFDTDDPEKRKHVYTLRAILMHDGAVVAGRHLYVYVRGDNGDWWKIQDHIITKVEWKDIANDSTGLYMDGGPYQLLYSREGPIPGSNPTTNLEINTNTAKEPILPDDPGVTPQASLKHEFPRHPDDTPLAAEMDAPKDVPKEKDKEKDLIDLDTGVDGK